jgi:L-lactate permease
LLAIIIAWFFAPFMKGAAGFGTPIALAAPLLVSLGFTPVVAVALPLIGHVAGTSFGALGIPLKDDRESTPYTLIADRLQPHCPIRECAAGLISDRVRNPSCELVLRSGKPQ